MLVGESDSYAGTIDPAGAGLPDRRQCSGRLDAVVATEAIVSDDDRSGMDAAMRLAEPGLPGHALSRRLAAVAASATKRKREPVHAGRFPAERAVGSSGAGGVVSSRGVWLSPGALAASVQLG